MAERMLPAGVEVYEINGPLFFGVADRLKDTLRALERPPKVFILRMRRVPAIDATGLHALDEFREKCRGQGTVLLLSGVHAQPMAAMLAARFDEALGPDAMFGSFDEALDRARVLLGLPPSAHPAEALPRSGASRKKLRRPRNRLDCQPRGGHASLNRRLRSVATSSPVAWPVAGTARSALPAYPRPRRSAGHSRRNR